MGKNQLIIVAVSLVAVGMAGVFTTNQFRRSHECSETLVIMGMMGGEMGCGMMGGGMMKENQMMKGMMQEMMSGRLPPGIEPEDLPDPDSRGAKLLVRYCAQCHNLPSPGMHSGEEWPGVTWRMFHRMAMMDGMMGIESPSPKERETIVAYLKTYSLRPITPGTLPSPELEGAISFKNTCSQCHALPDPKLHTADEWQKVVERMRSNMKTMGKRVITDQERNEIVSYLAVHARQSATPQ